MSCLVSQLLVLLLACAALHYTSSAAARGAVKCLSVHETFEVGEVFSDEHCRRVKCINFKGSGFVIEVEKCPLPDLPEGANCTMQQDLEKDFPLCCPKAFCGSV